MTNRDYVTTAELATLLGATQRNILYLLKNLVDCGIVAKSGSNRYTKYSLKVDVFGSGEVGSGEF